MSTREQGCKRCGTEGPWPRHWPELHGDGECWDCGAETPDGATMCGPCQWEYNAWRAQK